MPRFLTFARRAARPLRPRSRALVGLVLCCGLLHPLRATAQAPFNAGILPAGAVQVQAQSLAYVAPSSRGGWTWVLPSVGAGLGRGVEVSVGASAVRPRPFGAAPTDLTLAAKWRAFADSTLGTSLAVGGFALVPTSMAPRDDVRPDRYSFVYAAASQAVPFRWGSDDDRLMPLLTLAGFTTVARDPLLREAFGERRDGVSLGVDQLLPTGLTRAVGLRGPEDMLALSVNWVSGNSIFGYASASLAIVSGRHAWSFGYARGNQWARNHGPSIAYAFTY